MLVILTFNHDDHPDHFVISHGIPGSLPAAISERRLEVPNPACCRMLEALELLMVVMRWGMVMVHPMSDLTFVDAFHAAALAIKLAEGGPKTGFSFHKLDQPC